MHSVVPSEPESLEIQAHEAWEAGRLKEAFRSFKHAVDLGATECLLNLGYFHDTGIGTRKDKVEAMRCYKLAYRWGVSAAASNIAVLYREQGKPRLMFAWYRRAATWATVMRNSNLRSACWTVEAFAARQLTQNDTSAGPRPRN